jgi:hypothetical protein
MGLSRASGANAYLRQHPIRQESAHLNFSAQAGSKTNGFLFGWHGKKSHTRQKLQCLLVNCITILGNKSSFV